MKTIVKNSIKGLVATAVTLMTIGTAANADVLKRDTVYVIKGMGTYNGNDYDFPLGAYKVEADGNLTHIEDKIVNTPRHSAVGLAVCTKNKRVFVSHESSDTVDVLDGETFEILSDIKIDGTGNIAGIVFSENRGRLYAVNRGSTDVYVYRVNALGNVERVQSEEFNATSGIYGIDVWGDRLYVTHGYSNLVTVYDLDDRSQVDTYTTTSSVNMAIAVDGSDPSNVMVYTTWTSQSSSASILTQYNVNTDVERRIDLGRDGRGISVNPALGHVYAVTGDDSDTDAPVVRTYGEDQFTVIATSPTPLDEDPLIKGQSPTDVYAAGITFNPQVSIEIINPADANISEGMEVTFEITIKNESSEYNMTLNDMEDTYITDDISFVSSSLTPDDMTDDGNITWSNQNITIAPEGNYTFTKTFTALREVNCSTETITITGAELDLGEGTRQLDPFGNTIYFDIGPSCGCDPELEERDSGSAMGVLSGLMLALFTLLLGSRAIGRNNANS